MLQVGAVPACLGHCVQSCCSAPDLLHICTFMSVQTARSVRYVMWPLLIGMQPSMQGP